VYHNLVSGEATIRNLPLRFSIKDIIHEVCSWTPFRVYFVVNLWSRSWQLLCLGLR